MPDPNAPAPEAEPVASEAFPSGARRTLEGSTSLLSGEAVELLETTPRYAVHAFVWLLVPMVVTAFAWSALAKVDRIVVADAVLVAEGDVLKVRAPMTGNLKELKVREGAHVKKGDLLYELWSREAAREVADMERTTQARELAHEDLEVRFPSKKRHYQQRVARIRERLDALVELGECNKQISEKAGQETKTVTQAKQLELDSKRAQLPKLDAEIEHREETLGRLRGELQKCEKMLADGFAKEDVVTLARDRLGDAKIALQRATRERLALDAEVRGLVIELGRLAQALSLRLAEIVKEDIQNRAAAASLKSEIAQLESELESEKNALTSRLRTAELEERKARSVSFRGVSEDSVAIQAETDGIVTQIAVRQRGELVSAGDLVLTLRPQDARLVAQLLVLNKDIGHVSSGQPAKIKYDAYPYMDYGIKKGVVTKVPPDATPDQRLGPVYLVTVAPVDSTILVKGKEQPLSFGLKATVEIVTEQDTVLSFFLKPFKELQEGATAMPR